MEDSFKGINVVIKLEIGSLDDRSKIDVLDVEQSPIQQGPGSVLDLFYARSIYAYHHVT